MELPLYPFELFRQHFLAFAVACVSIVFLIGSVVYVYDKYQPSELASFVESFFGEGLNQSVDLTAYNQIGANAVPPVMRLGGVANQLSTSDINTATANIARGVFDNTTIKFLIIFVTLFLGYAGYALVSRMVFELKSGNKPFLGLKGLNPASLLLCFIATALLSLFAAFSLQGFEVVLMLNFCVPLSFAIPLAASGLGVGESLYQAFNFIRASIRRIAGVYILCMGVAISAPIALLLVFMFPLSVIHASAVPTVKLFLSLFGVCFALFYQYAVCSRAVLDFSRRTQPHAPAYTRMVRKIR